MLDRNLWRSRRIYTYLCNEVYEKRKGLLLKIFKSITQDDRESSTLGALKNKRITYKDWRNFLKNELHIFNAVFNVRQADFAFVQSTSNVNNQFKFWKRYCTLDFVGFMEALARVTDMVLIPTDAQLRVLGVENIRDFYRIMDKTGLWSSFDVDSTERLDESHLLLSFEGGHVGIHPRAMDSRPMAEKLEVFIELMMCAQDRKKEKSQERAFWLRPTVRRRMTHMHGLASKSEDDNEESFEVRTAAMLHEIWRMNRGKGDDGRYIPRIKIVDGREYDIANLSFKYLPGIYRFENLLAAGRACESIRNAWVNLMQERGRDEAAPPPLEQREKIKKESYWKVARESVMMKKGWSAIAEGVPALTDLNAFCDVLRSPAFIENSAEAQHEAWVKRNKHNNWIPKDQLLPYDELSEEEKRKDRSIVETAVEVYLARALGDDDEIIRILTK